ncbi:MAG: hypothetical protein LBM05_02195, partial [Endomicrobium sp.]|nr:hypothetical protein [Endomicrobium sp.]
MNIKKINRTNNELTPLMKQYWEIKSKYLNFILFFRLGDFYEMFANDAIIVAPILNIVLTQRCGIPMCGIPYLSINSYLKKIIETGLKVAICDQKQTHRQLKKTVLVERAVTKIITPGMILEDILLDSKTNNYLMAILSDQKSSEISCAIADISTGIFLTYQTNVRFIKNDIFKYNPKEILVPECPDNNNVFEAINIKQNFLVSKIKKSFFDLDNSKKIISELFGLNSLKKFELNNNRIICICGALLLYIKEMQPKSVLIFSKIKYISNEDFMYLDSNTIRNLEIVNSNLNVDKIDHSLLSILDKTQTALGARTLRQWILKPLLNISRIKKRQTIVYFFIQNQILCDNIVKQLRKIYDVERIVARIISETVTPRDLTILKQSLKAICEINEILQSNPNKDFVLQTANLKEIISKINLYIQDENLKISFNDGTMIKSGIHDGLDKLKDNLEITKSAILSLESKEQSHTGFKNHLKIRFTSILGYFFEISKSKLNNNRLPKHYILKQTTTNTERYITLELKNLEEKILYTHDQIVRLEHTLFHSL